MLVEKESFSGNQVPDILSTLRASCKSQSRIYNDQACSAAAQAGYAYQMTSGHQYPQAPRPPLNKKSEVRARERRAPTALDWKWLVRPICGPTAL